MRLGRVGIRASHELRVALRIVAEYFLREGVVVDMAGALWPQTVGDADDARRERGRALCHQLNLRLRRERRPRRAQGEGPLGA